MSSDVVVVIRSRGAGEAVREIRQVGDAADNAAGGAGRLGSALSGVGKIAAGFVIGQGLLKLPSLFSGMLSGASDVQESLSKVRVVFGDSAGAVEAFAKSAASSMGISRGAALEAAGTFGNLFSTMGLSKPAAAEMSQGLVGLAADLASFNNIDTATALEKLRSGLVGEVEPLRTLGVNLNAATVEARAMEMGLVDANGEVTEAGKVQARYSLILEQTKTAQGDFARTSGGHANQMRILKAQLADVSATLGGAFLPVVVATGRALIAAVGPVQALGRELAERLGPIAERVVALLKDQWPLAVAGLAGAVTALAVPALVALTAAIGGLTVAAATNPLVLIMAAAAAVGVALYVAYTRSQQFRDALGRLGSALGEIAGAAAPLASISLDWLQDLGAVAWDGIQAAFGAIRDALGAVDWEAIGGFFAQLGAQAWDGIQAAFGAVRDALGAVDWEAIGGFFAQLGAVAWQELQAAFRAMSEALGIDWGKVGGGLKELASSSGRAAALADAWERVKSAIAPVWEIIEGPLTRAFENLKGALEPTLKAVGNLLQAFAPLVPVLRPLAVALGAVLVAAVVALAFALEGLTKVLAIALPLAINVVAALVKPLAVALATMAGAVLEFVTGVAQALVPLAQFFRDAFGAVTAFLTEMVPSFVERGAAVVAGMLSGIWGGFVDVLMWAGRAGSMIIGAFGDAASLLLELGKDVIRGLWNGIESMKDWLIDKAKAVGGWIKDSIGGVLDISSPSRVMAREIGRPIVEGIAMGMMEAIPSLSAAADVVKDKLVAALSGAEPRPSEGGGSPPGWTPAGGWGSSLAYDPSTDSWRPADQVGWQTGPADLGMQAIVQEFSQRIIEQFGNTLLGTSSLAWDVMRGDMRGVLSGYGTYMGMMFPPVSTPPLGAPVGAGGGSWWSTVHNPGGGSIDLATGRYVAGPKDPLVVELKLDSAVLARAVVADLSRTVP